MGIVNKVFTKIKDSFNLVFKTYRESKIGSALKKFFDKGNRRYVLSLYLISLLVFGATLFTNQMVIAISGDFKLQEIPFYYNGYDSWWNSLLEGEFKMWDESGFLGQNNIGTNTFYYLWNIFFLPTLLFPRALVPQALAFMIVTKFVLAGYVMKRLLDYFSISDRTSKLIATAYAFSGWSFYYLWFNHFLEIAVLFPLVLLGIEKVLKEKKVGTLILSLFVSAMTNYFFFIMFCFCGVIYALFRYFQLIRTYSTKDKFLIMGLGILSFAVAICMALIILIPAFKVASQSSRANTSTGYVHDLKEALTALLDSMQHKEDSKDFWECFKSLWNLCFKFQGNEALKDNVYPLASYFYPPFSCYDSPLFSNKGYDNTNCSIFMYTPLTLMLIPSLIQSIKERKASHIIGFIGVLIMLFSPFFYYCFTGFTSVCYGRWQLFVVAVGLIYIAFNLDKIKEMKGWYFDLSFIVSLAFEISLLIIALKYQGKMNTNELLSETVLADRLICALIQPIVLTTMYFIIRHQFKKKNFGAKLNFALIAEITFVGNMVLISQGTVDYSSLYGGQNDVNSSIRLINDINKKDDTYFRVFNTSADRDANNLGMIEGYRGVGAFHSMYNYELDEFAEWSRLTYSTSSKSWRPWSMGYHEKRPNLDTFLGVKYYIVNANDSRIAINEDLIKISNGTWYVGGTNIRYDAFTASSVPYESGEYVISSISLTKSSDDINVYKVNFETNTSGENRNKAFNVTLVNEDDVEIHIGDNGNWFFNNLDIGVKGCPSSLEGGLKNTIKHFTKIKEGNNARIDFTLTNDVKASAVIVNGEDRNVPFGYKEIARDEYNVVYENENFINLGFAYDNMTDADTMSSSDSFNQYRYQGRTIINENAYLKTAILSFDDIQEIQSLYPNEFTKCSRVYDNHDITDDINIVNIDNKDINIYLQEWEHDKGIATNYADPVTYPGTSIDQIYWNSYMEADVSSYNIASEAKERGGAFVSVNARMGENLMVTLYGKDGNNNDIELVRDIHMKHGYDKSGDWKYERGFFVGSQVTKIIVRAYDTFAKGKQFAKPNVTFEYYDTYKANIDKLKKYSLEDVVIKPNGVNFKTSYTEDKIEILNIPYDEGWKLTRIDSNGQKSKVKLYKGQGGFNAFVAKKGNYSYSLDYTTPGLSTGIIGFGIGLTLFSFMYVAFDLEASSKREIKKQLCF